MFEPPQAFSLLLPHGLAQAVLDQRCLDLLLSDGNVVALFSALHDHVDNSVQVEAKFAGQLQLCRERSSIDCQNHVASAKVKALSEAPIGYLTHDETTPTGLRSSEAEAEVALEIVIAKHDWQRRVTSSALRLSEARGDSRECG